MTPSKSIKIATRGIVNSLLYFWHCCDCFQDVRMTHGHDVFSDFINSEENLEMTSSSKRSSNYQFNSNFDLCQVISVKCWNISFNFSTWSTWLILISSSHLPTNPKEPPCSLYCMVTIILQIEFECLESGAYKIRTNGANLRQDLLFGSDILDIGRVLE